MTKKESSIAKLFQEFFDFRKKDEEMGIHLNKTEMENLDFNENFLVYTSDDVECRYILSPKLMELLLRLKRKFRNSRVDFVMKDNSLHVAVNWRRDLFEPAPLEASIKRHISFIKNLAGQIKLCCDLVEDLDLNTRIWTRA